MDVVPCSALRRVEICVATPEGVKRHSRMWTLDCPKDFAEWVAAFGTLL